MSWHDIAAIATFSQIGLSLYFFVLDETVSNDNFCLNNQFSIIGFSIQIWGLSVESAMQIFKNLYIDWFDVFRKVVGYD